MEPTASTLQSAFQPFPGAVGNKANLEQVDAEPAPEAGEL